MKRTSPTSAQTEKYFKEMIDKIMAFSLTTYHDILSETDTEKMTLKEWWQKKKTLKEWVDNYRGSEKLFWKPGRAWLTEANLNSVYDKMTGQLSGMCHS